MLKAAANGRAQLAERTLVALLVASIGPSLQRFPWRYQQGNLLIYTSPCWPTQSRAEQKSFSMTNRTDNGRPSGDYAVTGNNRVYG